MLTKNHRVIKWAYRNERPDRSVTQLSSSTGTQVGGVQTNLSCFSATLGFSLHAPPSISVLPKLFHFQREFLTSHSKGESSRSGVSGHPALYIPSVLPLPPAHCPLPPISFALEDALWQGAEATGESGV